MVEAISVGLYTPWRVSSLRIVMSVIDPGPWWPLTEMLLIFEMSMLEPVLPAGSIPFEPFALAPHLSPDTYGFSPEAERNSMSPRTRRSIAPVAMSRRPQG